MNPLKQLIAFFILFTGIQIYAQISGCTDPLARNYNSFANQNDGSCTYSSTDITPLENWILPSTLEETSGLLIWNNKFWTLNDNSDINIYSIDTGDINNLQQYSLNNTENVDWEEITQDSTYLYIGDFGNNFSGDRKDLKILRIEKNSLLISHPVIDTIFFNYSLQSDFSSVSTNTTNFDCEAFILSSDSIYLFTKEWTTGKTSIYSLPKIPGNYTAQFRDIYDVNGLITGSVYFEKERLIVLSAYSTFLNPFLLLLYDYKADNFISGNKRKISVNLSAFQIEGIASEDGLTYYLSNEKFERSIVTVKQQINKFNLTEYLSNYLNNTSGIISKSSEDLIIYPNPANDYVIVNINDGLIGKNYYITDISGRSLIKGRLNSVIEIIYINNLNEGLYYFVIEGYKSFPVVITD